MTGPHRRFDPAELTVPGEPEPTAAEMADSLLAARELESLAMDTSVRPSDGFEDRVMAAIASEPAPRLVLMPAASVRGGRVGAFLLAVRESWAIATSPGRPMAVRGQALAFVLLFLLAAGALTGVTAVGVGALLGPNGASGPVQTPNPATPTAPVPTPTPAATDAPEPTISPAPTATEPTETPEATETAQPTETPRTTRTPRPTQAHETPEPTETPEGTDDHGGGGGPGPGGTDDHGGGGGGGGGDDGSGGSGGGGDGSGGGSGPG